jgi:diketogulonate reductase-like aldo/keto reductase
MSEMLTELIQGTVVPKLGLGTFELVGEAAIDTVQKAVETGYRHFDTASKYGNEQAVGEGLSRSGLSRDEFFLTTKVWITDLHPDTIVQTVAASVADLQVENVDLLLLHWPSPHFGLKESIESLSLTKDAGLARQIGVSNFPPSMLLEALNYGDLFCNQVEFHPYLDQTPLLRIAAERDLLLTGYAPLAIGRVSEDPLLQAIGEKHGKTAAQVALRWLVEHRKVAVMPKSKSPHRLQENFDIWDFALSQEDTDSIATLAHGFRIYDEEWVADWEDNSRDAGPALRSVTLS